MKCFADFGSECNILKTKDCDGCSFFKTKEQFEQGKKKSMKKNKKAINICF